MRLRVVGLVAARELREAMRSRWFAMAAICFLLLSLGLSMLGLAGAQRSGLAGFDRTTASLLNLALVFVPLVTLTLGGLSIAGEIEDQSLGLLLAETGRMEEAAGMLARAANGLSGNPRAAYNAGLALAQVGRDAEAEARRLVSVAREEVVREAGALRDAVLEEARAAADAIEMGEVHA